MKQNTTARKSDAENANGIQLANEEKETEQKFLVVSMKSELYLTICYKEREFVVVLKTGKQTERIYSEINSILI